jgi:hypothetical protein
MALLYNHVDDTHMQLNRLSSHHPTELVVTWSGGKHLTDFITPFPPIQEGLDATPEIKTRFREMSRVFHTLPRDYPRKPGFLIKR